MTRWLIIAIFLLLAVKARAQGTGGPHPGVGRCPVGQFEIGDNANAPPTCAPGSGGGGGGFIGTGPVQITANSNNGTDFIAGLAKDMGTYYVDGFGAKGDGVTDDTAAVRATAAAVCASGQAGIVRFSPNKTYSLSTGFSSGTCGAAKLDYPCSNLYYDAYGAKISMMVGGGSPGICVGNHNATPEDLTIAKPIASGATVGSNAVTLTTHSDASFFTPGDPVVIQLNPVVSFFFITVNYVTSVNASTGVLTLQNPLQKTFTPNPVIADVAHAGTSGGGWVHNIGWFGGEIDTNEPYIFISLAHDNATIRDVLINDSRTANTDLIGGIDFYGDVYDHITVNVACSNAFDFGSRGTSHVTVVNSFISETGGPTGCVSTAIPVGLLIVGEFSSGITVDHNVFSDSTGSGDILIGAFSESTKFMNNTAYFAAPVSTTFPHSPLDFNSQDTIVAGNNLVRGGPTTIGNFINDRGGAVFSNNTVEDYGSSGTTVIAANGALVDNNNIITHGTATPGLTIFVGAIAIGNTIQGPGSGTGIAVGDPGSPSTIPVIAQGNNVSGWTTPLFFAAPTNVLYPLIMNNGPGSLLYMVNPNNPTDALVAPGMLSVDFGALGTGGTVPNPVVNIHSDAGSGSNSNFRLDYATAGAWDLIANNNQAENTFGTWDMEMNTNLSGQGLVTFSWQPNGGAAINRFTLSSNGTLALRGALSIQSLTDTQPREQLVDGAGLCTGNGTAACVTRINETGIFAEGQFLFSGLAANLTANGQRGFCSDCKSVASDGAVAGAVCVNAGTGAPAIRVNGVFQCN